MILQDIEYYFKEGKLGEVFEPFREPFDRIVFYEDSLKNGVVDTPDEIYQAIKELVAIFSLLNVTAKIAETYKTNTEVKYYNTRKIELQKEAKAERITSAFLDKEASYHVTEYRRVANIFAAYRDSCDRIVSVLQSCLKSLDREKGMHNQA